MKKILSPLAVLSIVLLFMNCGGDDGPEPGPTPTPTTETVSKTYKVGRNDHYGKGWKNGKSEVSGNSNNTAKEIKLSKTVTANKSQNTKNKTASYVLDSVTIHWNDELVYKEKNVTLSTATSSTTSDITNKLELFSHIATISKINLEGSTWYAIKGNDTLSEVKAQNGVPSKAILSFLNRENTTTVNLVGVNQGYEKVSILSVKVQEEYVHNADVIFENRNPKGKFKLVDIDTKKTIENLLIVTGDGEEIPIDSTYIFSQPFGQLKLDVKPTDSTWMNPGIINIDTKFETAFQEISIEVKAEKKRFYGDITVNVKDEDGINLDGVVLASLDKNATTNSEGNATLYDIAEILADRQKPWLSATGIGSYYLLKDGYKQFDEKEVSLKEGNNLFNEVLEKENNNTANATFTFIDKESKEVIENLLIARDQKIVAIDDEYRITNERLGEYAFNVVNSDSTWMYVPSDYLVKKDLVDGENNFTIEIDTELRIFYANLAVSIKDQDNNAVTSAKLSASEKTALSDSNGLAYINRIAQLVGREDKPWIAKETTTTYDVEKDGYDDIDARTVALKEGTNQYNSTLTKSGTSSNDNFGDIYVYGELNGNPIDNMQITLTNETTPDSTYTVHTGNDDIGYFPKVYNGKYTINIEDDDFDDRYEITTTSREVTKGQNSNENVTLDAFEKEVDITVVVRDNETSNKVSGQTVYLVQNNTNTIVDTQTTNGSGEAVFDDAQGGIEYHIVNEGSGTYKKTNGAFDSNNVVVRSDKEQTINTTAIADLYTKDNNYIPGDIVELFRPQAYNTEFLLGHLRMYFPPSDGRQEVVDQFNEAAELLGFPGAIIAYSTQFGQPTQSQIAGYDPRSQSRQVFPGQIGTDITNYVGTGTGTNPKIIEGNKVIFYATVFNIGGLDKSRNNHELTNLLGFPLLNGNTTTFKTSRDELAGENFSLQDATYDIPVMNAWLQSGKHHYDSTDNQGRSIEYNITTKIE